MNMPVQSCGLIRERHIALFLMSLCSPSGAMVCKTSLSTIQQARLSPHVQLVRSKSKHLMLKAVSVCNINKLEPSAL